MSAIFIPIIGFLSYFFQLNVQDKLEIKALKTVNWTKKKYMEQQRRT